MAFEVKRLVHNRQCCGSPMSTYELRDEYGTQRKKIEYECDDCGRIFRDAGEKLLTLRFIFQK